VTNIETLLQVEGGTVPAGVEVFREPDLQAGRRRMWALISMALAATAVTLMVREGGKAFEWQPIMLLALLSGAALIMALPTRAEPREARISRILIVSPQGLIARDHWGLQNFDFSEMDSVRRCFVCGTPHLCIRDRFGQEHLLSYAAFDRAERIPFLLSERVGPTL